MARKPPAKPRKRSASPKKGRPSRCTPTMITAITDRIRAGMGREAAARQAGIGVATLHEWVARGRAGEEPYAEFSRRIEAASADLQSEVSGVLLSGLRSSNEHVSTRMATWLAERLWPDVYGRRQETRLSGPEGGPVQVAAQVEVRPLFSDEAVASMSAEQLEAALSGLVGGGE